MKQVKEAGIPIPPSGYWTKLSFGKPVSRLALTEPANEVLTIVKTAPVTSKSIGGKVNAPSSIPATSQKGEASLLDEKETGSIPSAEVNEMAGDIQDRDEPEIFEQYGQSYSVYDREILYKEVWERPVTEVAKRYKVSDVAIHKVCKALDVPTPPAGYWAKLRACKPVTKLPLPESNKPAKKTGLRIGTESHPRAKEEKLSFLSDEDKSVVLSVAMQIRIPDENAKMHPTIVAHRKKVSEWKKKLRNRQGTDSTPFLADTVAEDTLPRVFRIIDALIKAMEPLGCSLTSDLKFVVNGETVPVTISEAEDQTDHVLTKEEHVQLLENEENKRRNKWASKPNIRKYDYAYNGHISFMVYKTRRFRDSEACVVEDRLGDIMIALYEASDAIRRERQALEEAERRRQEEERRKEERRERYNAEVERTQALVNLAEDFETACVIRRYVSALETSGNLTEKQKSWIEWAKAKADWYDPTIAREDDLFGKRKHEEDKEQKKLKHPGHRWW